MRAMLLASMAAAGLVTVGRDLAVRDPLRMYELDVPEGLDAIASVPIPRAPRQRAGTSRYVPHQGSREMERRRKQMAKAAARLA